MIQGIIAVILLGLAFALYFWGRRSASTTPAHEDADVVLGLQERSSDSIETIIAPQPEPQLEPVQVTPPPALKLPIQREILFLRASPKRPFGGYELLQSLLSCGLSWGEQNRIFHRYEQHTDSEVELFSVAAATKSGELNPADMGEFTCPGLSLFVTLNTHIYPSVNFELMLDAARQLAEDLGGDLLDQQQELLTPEKLQKIREKVKQFETSQQTMELFV